MMRGTAMGYPCPVCGQNTYRMEEGTYDHEEYGQGKKLSPDEYWCTYCGFGWWEDMRPEYSEEKAAARYKKRWERKIKKAKEVP